MKTKKLTKKLENTILKKKFKSFDFFTLEYCSSTNSFLKKNKNAIIKLNNFKLKHPLHFNSFKSIEDLKFYLMNKNSRTILICIKNLYIKQNTIDNIYIDSSYNIKMLFLCFKKLYVLWCFI
jgi:UDP-N-acetylmuramate-alanine ligase